MESAGTFTVSGTGSDIGGTADQFHFVYQALRGDLDIRAEVMSLTGPNAGSKGGVMIRESLSSPARQAVTAATQGQGLSFIRRATAGRTATVTTRAGVAPVFVRLVRAGNLFTSYVSDDGVTWQLVGSDTIVMGSQVYVGLAITSRNSTRPATMSVNGVTFTPVGTTTPPPAAQWSNGDVGNPAVAGRASQASGVYSVAGAGTDVWDPTDQFQFMYQSITGDTDIVARVQSIDRTNDKAKAGVMIRGALTGTAPYAYMFGTAATGWAWRSRAAEGVQSVHLVGSMTPNPGWVRLVRRGNTLTGYESADGTTWTMVGSDTFVLPSTVYVGLAVTSRAPTDLATGTFTNVAINGSASTNQLPTVALTSPASGASFTAPASISISANAADSDGTISRVDFYNGATLLGSDTTSPYAFSWSGVAAGTYTLTARATDNSGAVTTSSAVTVTVAAPPNQLPTVGLTSPVGGASFTAPASIAISANATDSDGTISRVDFYNGATLLGSDTASPYAFSWSSVPAGTYTLTARATDNSGASTTSAPVTVTVGAAVNLPPTVALTSPANGGSFVAPAVVSLSATAADSDGAITRVDFYQGSTLIGSATSSPYTVTWSNVAAGTYTLTARATDSGGASATSSAVTITVNAASLPTTVAFAPSVDHTSGVDSYTVEIRRGSDAATATPVATKSLGKPAPVNNEIAADISDIVNPLAAGTYYAVVVARGAGGAGASTPSGSFVK